MDALIHWLDNYIHGPALVFVVSMLPIIELRGTIPIGLAMGMDLWPTFILAYIGSCVPGPLIILFIRDVFKWLKTYPNWRRWIEKLEAKTLARGDRTRKLGLFGLFLFVAIPLPGTGVWTGSLLSVLLGFRFIHSVIAVSLGNFVAGLLILGLSYGVFNVIG
ncbi:MAG: small multi-drug export protein [Tissierellia bacterium]|jgi:uncharacterized membrane protein|nr:small multi-drug export protein [Bacillota bacterium]NLK58258.1 small multi-drug export protein [Tissierellia bacterium]